MPASTIVDGCRPCSRCRVIKQICAENFHRNAARGDGYASTCRECFGAIDKERNEKRKVGRALQAKIHYERNKERKQALSRLWKKVNRQRSYELDARSLKKRLASDPVFKFSRRVSSSIRRDMNGLKSGRHWENLLGYTVHDLRAHLEAQFTPPMSWGNYGTYWQIDHIKPIAAFGLPFKAPTDEIMERAKECWALSNLQPLEARANASKGARWQESTEMTAWL